MAEFTEGVCGDGAAILRDGQQLTISEVLELLNASAPAEDAALVAKWLADNEAIFEATRKQRDTYGERALKAEAERDEARRQIERMKLDRLKLDRRIHNQRKAWRDTWEIVEMRRRWLGSDSARKYALRYGQTTMEVNKRIVEVTAERDALAERLRDAEEALALYADEDSYVAISFMTDPPCGDFMDDFSDDGNDYGRPMPGKCARAYFIRHAPLTQASAPETGDAS